MRKNDELSDTYAINPGDKGKGFCVLSGPHWPGSIGKWAIKRAYYTVLFEECGCIMEMQYGPLKIRIDHPDRFSFPDHCPICARRKHREARAARVKKITIAGDELIALAHRVWKP